MGKCIFNPLWLNQENYRNWIASSSDKYKAHCLVCKKDFELGKMGEASVKSHMNGKKHTSLIKVRETASGNLQMFFSKVEAEKKDSDKVGLGTIPSTHEATTSTVQVSKNLVLDAEIRWVVKCISSHFSYSSCTEINNLFREMFPDSAIAKQFTCGPSKCAYIACFGLAPYYSSLLYKTVSVVENFCLIFDEALNKSLQSKQMDIYIRYWNNSTNTVETRYLNSVFLGHSTAEDTLKAFHDATHKLDLSKLIQLSMDGPNVNWKVFYMLQKEINEDFNKHMLNLGSCGLHVLNNAFKKGNRAAKWNLDSLFTALYWLFKDSPARRDDFLMIAEKKKLPSKFCCHRWLENVPVAERTLEIWADVKEFVNCANEKKINKPSSKSYVTVECATTDNLICVKLNFFLSVARILAPFLANYQSSKPMLPFFAEDLTKLIIDLLISFCIIKQENLDNLTANKVSKFDFKDKSCYAPVNKISLGFVADRIIKKLLFEKKISEKDAYNLKSDAQSFIIALLENIIEKSPINSLFVRNLSCLDPRQMAASSFKCYNRMKTILSCLIKANITEERECEEILLEYNKFINSVVLPNSKKFKDFSHTEDRLDFFFSLHSVDKYDKLYSIIKKLLILSHGQADVERGFSSNRLIEIENLKENTFVAQRVIIDHLKNTGGIAKFVIDKELRLYAASARQKYVLHLEEQRKIKETKAQGEKRKAVLDDLEELKSKKRRCEESVSELEKNADKLAEKAEKVGEIKYIYQSNSFRRTVKEKKEELKEIDVKIEAALKSLKEN